MPVSLAARLRVLGTVARRALVLRESLRWLAGTLGLWLGCFWLDNLLRLPPALRLPLFVVAIGWPAQRAWRHLLQRRVWQVTPERTARELERQCGMDDNAVINACQLEGAITGGATERFVHVIVDEGLRRTGALPATVLSQPRRLRRAACLAGLVVLCWAGYMAFLPRYAGNALRRLSRPLADVPPVGSVDIALEPSGRVAVYEGESLTVRAHVTRPGSDQPVQPAATPVLRLAQARDSHHVIEHPMAPEAGRPGSYRFTIDAIREPFVARVLAEDAGSPGVQVEVLRLPRVLASTFRILAPRYTGLPLLDAAGPPAALEVPAGGSVRVELELDRFIDSLVWLTGTNRLAFARHRKKWQILTSVAGMTEYRIAVVARGVTRELVRGPVVIRPDQPPEASFATDDRNRWVWPGETIQIPVEAHDDYGLSNVVVTVAPARQPEAGQPAQQWSFQGPPGRKEARETFRLMIDPARYAGGESYLLRAQASDFAGRRGVSDTVLLRVRRPQDAATGLNEADRRVVDALQKAIEEQRRALGLTRNLELNLDEALQAGHLNRHGQSIADSQGKARSHGRDAMREAEQSRSESLSRLRTLIENEMGLVLKDVGGLAAAPRVKLGPQANLISERQTYILSELLALLGRMATAARARADVAAGAAPPPAPTVQDAARDLQDALQEFVKAQRRMVEQSKLLAEKNPEDLTEAEQKILGQLAREEAQWAEFLKDKLNDLAKLPLQDFADGSLAQEFNEVYQEVQKAAAELYARKIDLAVPLEQSGLENAEELINNLERWLPNKPDSIKWEMEEPATTPDVPLAELPAELDDIVGELLDREEAMTEEVEDVTSSWIDSIDKGAGWDAMDGPISSMSAKGVTGNQLPNQTEIGGRSGEGRTGRSSGQMVESAAEGKDGRQTPSRLSPTPFESGSVEDKSTQDRGGATGGGKLSGFAERGLRGPAPPPRLEQMKRLAGKQAEIRQQAEKLSLQLRARHLPSGDLEESVASMKRFEELARTGRGGEIKRVFDAATTTLRDAQASVAEASGVRREHGGLSNVEAAELWSGLRDDIPAGYEEIVAAYYKRLAEGK
jgi:hypothetical protein